MLLTHVERTVCAAVHSASRKRGGIPATNDHRRAARSAGRPGTEGSSRVTGAAIGG
jgi:hypothetical protein